MSDPSGNGRNQITAAFTDALKSRTAALMPYYTLGYPDRETSLNIIEAIAAASDLLELGIPFSDPLADGPTIQHSTQIALENGTTVAACLEMVRELRQRGVQAPICLMGYYNPMLAYGLNRFVQDAQKAGVQGFIVPDLPPEEASELKSFASAAGLAYIYFLAPTSSKERIEQVTIEAQGFIYLVSVTGVTGARKSLHGDLAEFVQRVRARSDVPLAIGFGISTPSHAASVAQLADGVIVGSALINAVNAHDVDKPGAAVAFVHSLQTALNI
jgi:tryptophan synthase alpha chain